MSAVERANRMAWNGVNVILAGSLLNAQIWLQQIDSVMPGCVLVTPEEFEINSHVLDLQTTWVWVKSVDGLLEEILFNTAAVYYYNSMSGSRTLRDRCPERQKSIEAALTKTHSIGRWWLLDKGNFDNPHEAEYYIPAKFTKIWKHLDARVRYHLYSEAKAKATKYVTP